MRICTLASGSSGNSIYLGTQETNILIDAGISCKRINERLVERLGITGHDIDAVFITHEHTDHIQGLEVFVKKFKTPVYTTKGTWRGASEKIKNIDPDLCFDIKKDQTIHIQDVKIEAFPTPHDAQESVGFLVSCQEKSIGIATDLGMLTNSIINTLQGATALILESNYDEAMLWGGAYPGFLKKRISGPVGHLSNERAGQGLLDIVGQKTSTVVLAHLSQENNLPTVARRTVSQILEENRIQYSFDLQVAPRSQPGDCINI